MVYLCFWCAWHLTGPSSEKPAFEASLDWEASELWKLVVQLGTSVIKVTEFLVVWMHFGEIGPHILKGLWASPFSGGPKMCQTSAFQAWKTHVSAASSGVGGRCGGCHVDARAALWAKGSCSFRRHKTTRMISQRFPEILEFSRLTTEVFLLAFPAGIITESFRFRAMEEWTFQCQAKPQARNLKIFHGIYCWESAAKEM